MQIKKKIPLFVKVILIISSLVISSSCKNKKEEITSWSAAMSRPCYYVTDGPHIYYFSKGKLISGTETLTDIGGFGWAYADAARNNGEMAVFPDSVVVDYGGLNNKLQTCTYHGGMSLPQKQIEKLFKQGYFKDGIKEKFNYITTGMPPGGRICTWVDHIEIKRGIVEQKDIYLNHPVIFSNDIKNDSIEINNYLKNHPIDYSIWDKPDPRYDLGFGFCNEDNNVAFFVMYCLSKEGIRNVISNNEINFTKWNSPFGKKPNLNFYSGYQQLNDSSRNHKMCLPVDIQLRWKNKDKLLFDTHIVMLKDLPQRFAKSYINSETGKSTNFNRIVFGVEKDGQHCIIWLDGPGKQEKIMRFKGQLALKNDKGDYLKQVSYATEIQYY